MNIRKLLRFSVAWPVCVALTLWVILVRLAWKVIGAAEDLAHDAAWACFRRQDRAMTRACNVARWAYGKDDV